MCIYTHTQENNNKTRYIYLSLFIWCLNIDSLHTGNAPRILDFHENHHMFLVVGESIFFSLSSLCGSPSILGQWNPRNLFSNCGRWNLNLRLQLLSFELERCFVEWNSPWAYGLFTFRPGVTFQLGYFVTILLYQLWF